MCAQRLWPTVQALGRGLVSSRSEIFQQGVKAYNVQNFNSSHLGGGLQTGVAPCQDRAPWCQRVHQTARGTLSKVVSQPLHSGTVHFLKEFTDSENEHAHAILRSLPAYHATTVPPSGPPGPLTHQLAPYLSPSEWARHSPEAVADGFISLSQQCQHQNMDLESPLHTGLCSVLSRRLPEISDNQLLQVLAALALWPPTSATTTPNFMELWNGLDRECTERIRRWDMDHMFLVADHWFRLKLSRISLYNVEMTKVLGKRVTSMHPTQLVQYLFYANLSRKLEPFIIKKDMEKKLCEVLDFLSVEELGVIAMGFFKTQTFLTSEKLVEAIVKKTIASLECVSDPSLGAILKLLRKSVRVTQWRLVQDLLKALVPQVERLNPMCLLQVALLGTDLMVHHPPVLEAIVQRFAQDMDSLRLKDLERITFVLMLFGHAPPGGLDLPSLVAGQLRQRTPEINHYPKSFVSCVVYLTTLGHLPLDLISAALQPSMLKLLRMNRNYTSMGREVNELDWTLEVEGPVNYRGYRLDPQTRHNLTKEYLGRLPSDAIDPKSLTHQERLTLEVRGKLVALLGGHHLVSLAHVLPHSLNPDIIFCTGEGGQPEEVPEEYLSLPPTALKRSPAFPAWLRWNAVVVAGRNAFLRNSQDLRGQMKMKLRQLATLGYSVSVVPYMEYTGKSLRAKLVCLERALQDGSTLNTSGRVDAAWDALKTLQKTND